MAENARFLPKWQALQILCQTLCQIGNSKYRAKNRAMKKSPHGFFLFFFLAIDDM
jgi:hypothetical protein